jgi:hypothetical protein
MDLFGSLVTSWLYIFNIARRQTHLKPKTLDKDNTPKKKIYMIVGVLQLIKNMKTKTWTNFNPQKYECIENKGWFIV